MSGSTVALSERKYFSGVVAGSDLVAYFRPDLSRLSPFIIPANFQVPERVCFYGCMHAWKEERKEYVHGVYVCIFLYISMSTSVNTIAPSLCRN